MKPTFAEYCAVLSIAGCSYVAGAIFYALIGGTP